MAGADDAVIAERAVNDRGLADRGTGDASTVPLRQRFADTHPAVIRQDISQRVRRREFAIDDLLGRLYDAFEQIPFAVKVLEKAVKHALVLPSLELATSIEVVGERLDDLTLGIDRYVKVATRTKDQTASLWKAWLRTPSGFAAIAEKGGPTDFTDEASRQWAYFRRLNAALSDAVRRLYALHREGRNALKVAPALQRLSDRLDQEPRHALIARKKAEEAKLILHGQVPELRRTVNGLATALREYGSG